MLTFAPVKRWLALFLSLTVLLQAYSKGLVVLQYFANQEYIAENLCENRDVPEMHCDGKCHLKKEIQKDEQKEKSGQRSETEIVLFCAAMTPWAPEEIVVSERSARYFPLNKEALLAGMPRGVFHPPGVVG